MKNFLNKVIILILTIFIFNIQIFAATVNFRIEGTENTIIEKNTFGDTFIETLQNLGEVYNIPIVISNENGNSIIYSINGIKNGDINKNSCWKGFLIRDNKIIEITDINKTLLNNDNVVIYYGNNDTLIPSLNYTKDSNNNLNINITTTYTEWSQVGENIHSENITKNINGVSVHILSPSGVSSVLSTDENGSVSIPLKEKGYYSFYGESYNKNSVPSMVKTDVIKYLNGFNNKNKYITRGEFACLVATYYGITGKSDIQFSDVSMDNQYSKYIYALASKGIMVGYGDGTFGINKKVTALEAAAILERLININITLNENINVPYWAESGIALMIQKGIYNKNMNFNSGIDIYTADKIIKTNI